ncbi:MAG: hypothetical protein ACTMKU_06410 [Actinomycetaceae bacterium]
MTNDGRWRHEGNAFEQPGDDATRQMPAADQHASGAHAAGPQGGYGQPGYDGAPSHGAGPEHGGARAYGASSAPVYAPSSGRSSYDDGAGYDGPGYGGGGYGGGSGDDLPPGGGRGGRRGGFPWIGVIVAIIAVAAAAAAVWYFLLRDSGGEDGGDESATAGTSQTPEESTSDAAPPPTDPDEPSGDDAEEGSEEESEQGTGTGSGDEDATEDPEDGTDGSESPSDDDSEGQGGNDGETGGVVELEIGDTHTLSNGAEITLDEVERDFECRIPTSDPLVALTFTVVGGDTPTDTPRPGISLSTSEGDTGLLDGAGCLDDEGLSPVVESGEEASGIVLIAAPTEDPFDLEFSPVLSGFTGTPETLTWTID